jgi:hypothetical protein
MPALAQLAGSRLILFAAPDCSGVLGPAPASPLPSAAGQRCVRLLLRGATSLNITTSMSPGQEGGQQAGGGRTWPQPLSFSSWACNWQSNKPQPLVPGTQNLMGLQIHYAAGIVHTDTTACLWAAQQPKASHVACQTAAQCNRWPARPSSATQW